MPGADGQPGTEWAFVTAKALGATWALDGLLRAAAGRLDPLPLDDRERPCTGSAAPLRVRTPPACAPAAAPIMAARAQHRDDIIRFLGGTNTAAAHRAFSYRPADVLAALSTT